MSKTDKKQEEADTEHTADDVSSSKKKSKKRKRNSELDVSLDMYQTCKENIVENGSKKQKKESHGILPDNEIDDFIPETLELQPARKSKKDKKKNKASTLGVVDVDILQQAEINFQKKEKIYNAHDDGDNEPVEKKKKHSKKTKNVSFKEPDETTELPSKKKKHKKLKDGELLSEDITDNNESKQHSKKKKHKKLMDQELEETDKNKSEEPTKKRKHKDIEASSSELIVENVNEHSAKKKKHKDKKAELVSQEKVNEDADEQPMKRKKKSKEKKTEGESSEELNGDESEQPTKKKKKHKENKVEEKPHEELDKENKSEQPAKKKKKQKEKKSTTPSKEGDIVNKNEVALRYLRLWQSSRSAWKFNKMMQVYLLQNMYDTSLVTDEDFQILLLYLDGLQGKGREKTMEDAKKILDNGETKVNAEKEDRARQLFQMLA